MGKWRLLIGLIPLAAALLLVGACSDDGGTTVPVTKSDDQQSLYMYGHVYNEEEDPIEGATVTLTKAPSYTFYGESDEYGYYEVWGDKYIPSGFFGCTITHPDYLASGPWQVDPPCGEMNWTLYEE